jgi:hypothetical protein
MGALKPWHLLILSLCCLLPVVAAAIGGVWAVSKKRGQR